MTVTFTEKLRAVQTRTGSNWVMPISPSIEKLPITIARYDDPYLPLARAVLKATHDRVCAYLLDFTAYLAMGAAGAVALERSIDLLGFEHIVIVDGAFASADYAALWEETAFGMDGVTLLQGFTAPAFNGRADRVAFPREIGSVDSRDIPAYWIEPRIMGVGGLKMRLLPADLIEQSRSLDFEDTLRSRVEGLVQGGR